MKFKTSFSVLMLFPALSLGACAVQPPLGPTVTAMPGPGKSFPQFQADDTNCRNYAQSRTANAGNEAAAAGNNATNTAVLGTLIGAAAGAALGAAGGNAGAGAAVGAGAGLLGGASIGGAQAQNTADSLQNQYNIAYEQCMVGNGESVPNPPPVAYASPAYYDPPAVIYAAPPVGFAYLYGPPIVYFGPDGHRHYRYERRPDFHSGHYRPRGYAPHGYDADKKYPH